MRAVGKASRLTRRGTWDTRNRRMRGESKHCEQGSEARGPWWQLEGEGVETLSTRGLPPDVGRRREVVGVILRRDGKW